MTRLGFRPDRVLLATALAVLIGDPLARGADGDLLLVSYSGDHVVALISPDSGETVAKFPVVKGPHEITTTRDRALAYVANAGTGPGGEPGKTVSMLDLKTRRVTNFDLGSCEQPHDVRVSRDGSILWVACAPAQAILEMNARTGEIRRAWKTGVDGGWFLAVSPDDRKIYVPHLEGKRLVVIDRERGTVETAYAGGSLGGLDISPNGREVWVIDHEQRKLVIVDTGTDRAAASILLPSADFGRIRLSSDGRRAAVVQGKVLTVFDCAARRPISSIEMPYEGKVLDLSPSGRRAAVSNPEQNKVTVLDLETGKATGSFATGKTPDGVAWVN